MHPNPAFRKPDTQQNLAFARSRGFGVLCINGTAGPLLAHVPFVIGADGTCVDLHLARSNAVIASVPGPAVLMVSGPDHYISPDWYGVPDQVPTWNYIAIDLRGQLIAMPPESLEPHLADLSDRFESDLAPKPVWKAAKMSDGVMPRMMRMILPFRLVIETVDGTWKLGQNKSVAARAGVIAALGDHDPVAQAMRAVPED